MKILYIAHNAAHGGATNALINMLDVVRKNNDIMVVMPYNTDTNNILLSYVRSNDIPYYCNTFYTAYCYGNDNFFLRRYIRTCGQIIRTWRMRRVLKNIIKEFKPDIVHSNSGVVDIALDTCKKMRIPHIWHLREYQDLDFKIKMLPTPQRWKKKILSEGNYNIAITKGIFEYFHLREGVDCYIYDAVLSLSKLKPLYCSHPREKAFLFVAGNINTPGKALLDLLKAFSIFCNEIIGWKLYVIGSINEMEQEYWNMCLCQIKDNGIEESVVFVGKSSNVTGYMQNSTCLVIPSHFEGFGFVTVEAMSNGCIVIGRDCAGTKEQFDNGVLYTGREIAFRFTEVSDLVEAMKKVSRMTNFDMQIQAHKTVYNFYTDKVFAEKLNDFYQNVLNSYYN